MHVQAKAAPAASPADLAEFLKVLAANRDTDRDAINIEGVSGAALERGGEFVFTVTHGRAREAHDRLTAARYTVKWCWDLYSEMIPPEDGAGGFAVSDDDDPTDRGSCSASCSGPGKRGSPAARTSTPSWSARSRTTPVAFTRR